MFFTISKILVWFIYPLSLGIFLLIAAFFLSYLKKKKLFNALLLSGIIILYIFSIRPTADFLLKPLESKYNVDKRDALNADAIVVLSGTGKRTVKGVSLFYKKAAPLIIMSGGSSSIFGHGTKGAVLMADLAVELGVPDEKIITEAESRNTEENALYTKQILDNINAKKVILVTSAFHMPRAYAVFKKLGISVTPIASDFVVKDKPYDPFSFIPDVENLRYSTVALKEYVGIIVYRLKGWI